MKSYRSFISTDSFSVVFPDFPGCVTKGKDFEDAVSMAQEALSGHTACMRDAHEEIPDPSSLEQIQRHWEDWIDWKNSEYTTALIAIPELRKVPLSMDSP